MAGEILNKQPIFTATPKIVADNPNCLIPNNSLNNPDNLGTFYTDDSTYGSLITKITVNGVCDIGGTITEKAIFLFITVPQGRVILYQTQIMSGLVSRTAQDTLPSVSFNLGGGISIAPGTSFSIGTSTNSDNTNESGDTVMALVLEGGTYDQPA